MGGMAAFAVSASGGSAGAAAGSAASRRGPEPQSTSRSDTGSRSGLSLARPDVPAREWRAHCPHCPYEAAPTSPFQKRRLALHLLLEEPSYSPAARVFHSCIITLILVSTVAFCLETVPSLRDSDVWFPLETAVVAVFSAEYLARVLTSSHLLHWAVQPLNIIDLLAVLPYFLEQASGTGGSGALRILRAVRLARIFRLFKISRYSSYMRIMTQALRKSADAFGLLLFFIGIAVIIFSSLMYHAEVDEREPGEDDPFTSIPATFYWCIVTMTTVGYGDAVPITSWGKFVASLTMICGILVIALPVTILSSNFAEVYMRHQASAQHRKKLTDAAVLGDDRALARPAESLKAAERMADHLLAIRRHRAALDTTLRQARALLEEHASGAATFQVWSVIDEVVISGLGRVEEMLADVRVGPPDGYDDEDAGAAVSGTLPGSPPPVAEEEEDDDDDEEEEEEEAHGERGDVDDEDRAGGSGRPVEL